MPKEDLNSTNVDKIVSFYPLARLSSGDKKKIKQYFANVGCQ